MCQIVQRVQVGQRPNQTEYLVLKNGRCVCIRPVDRLACSKATRLSFQLGQSVPALPPPPASS